MITKHAEMMADCSTPPDFRGSWAARSPRYTWEAWKPIHTPMRRNGKRQKPPCIRGPPGRGAKEIPAQRRPGARAGTARPNTIALRPMWCSTSRQSVHQKMQPISASKPQSRATNSRRWPGRVGQIVKRRSNEIAFRLPHGPDYAVHIKKQSPAVR